MSMIGTYQKENVVAVVPQPLDCLANRADMIIDRPHARGDAPASQVETRCIVLSVRITTRVAARRRLRGENCKKDDLPARHRRCFRAAHRSPPLELATGA
jgi:hypothetical protein